MASNGHLTSADLTPIPVGKELSNEAATAWLAPGGPADAGLRPVSAYRTYDEQVYFWDLYQSGQGNLAAAPGTSNHGNGTAVDIDASWEQSWIYEHGGAYGWKKTEAFSEAWHFNYVAGIYKGTPPFKTLQHGSKGPRVVKFTKRLAYIHKRKGPAYLKHWRWKFVDEVVDSVKAFQKSYRLKVDGEIGPKTAAKINAVFHQQREKRGSK
jgi:hypothetical protein